MTSTNIDQWPFDYNVERDAARIQTHHWSYEKGQRPLVACCGHSIWGIRKVGDGYVAHSIAVQLGDVTCPACAEKTALLLLAKTDL